MEKRKSTSKSLRVYAASFGVLSLVLLWLAMGASSEEGRLVGAYGFPETPPLSRLSSLNLVQNGGFGLHVPSPWAEALWRRLRGHEPVRRADLFSPQ